MAGRMHTCRAATLEPSLETDWQKTQDSPYSLQSSRRTAKHGRPITVECATLCAGAPKSPTWTA